jgi:hypothetical protein
MPDRAGGTNLAPGADSTNGTGGIARAGAGRGGVPEMGAAPDEPEAESAPDVDTAPEKEPPTSLVAKPQ